MFPENHNRNSYIMYTDPIADFLTRIRNASRANHKVVEIPASNFKKEITKILFEQGYILSYKFDDSSVQGSIKIALKYDKAFLNTVVKPLYVFDGNSSYHLYVVCVDFSKLKISKIELFNKMREKNIGLQLHYIPINKQPYYKSLGYGNEDTPIMNGYHEDSFSLPMYASLSNEEQEYVIKTLFEVLK